MARSADLRLSSPEAVAATSLSHSGPSAAMSPRTSSAASPKFTRWQQAAFTASQRSHIETLLQGHNRSHDHELLHQRHVPRAKASPLRRPWPETSTHQGRHGDATVEAALLLLCVLPALSEGGFLQLFMSELQCVAQPVQTSAARPCLRMMPHLAPWAISPATAVKVEEFPPSSPGADSRGPPARPQISRDRRMDARALLTLAAPCAALAGRRLNGRYTHTVGGGAVRWPTQAQRKCASASDPNWVRQN